MPSLGQRTRCREGRSVDADSGGREIDRRRGLRVVLGDQRMVQHDRSHCAAGDSTTDLLHGGRHVPNRVHAWHGDLLGGLESLPAGTLRLEEVAGHDIGEGHQRPSPSPSPGLFARDGYGR